MEVLYYYEGFKAQVVKQVTERCLCVAKEGSMAIRLLQKGLRALVVGRTFLDVWRAGTVGSILR